MVYIETLPVMNARGVEPPQSLKDAGWGGGDYPAAGHFIWYLHRAYKVLEELQTEGASIEWVQEQLASIAVPLVDSNTSTSKTEAPTADALRRTVESIAEALALKQDVLRLADNYLAPSVLINAAPDAQGRAYPNGVSMFKVVSNASWPAANGYVLTFRAGSGGYQIFYEMYTGNVQTDKTARQWTRSKRDSNTFWQDWARTMTEVDMTAHVADAAKHNYWGGPTSGTGGATAALAYKATVAGAQATGALPDGFPVTVTIGAANAAADPMLQVNDCTAYPIRRTATSPFAAGALKVGQLISLVKVGDYFLARSTGATGTATAAQVRAGATFSNENGVDLTGTLPVRATAAQTITPGTTNQVRDAGIYDSAITVQGSTNLISSNIRQGVNIFGIGGSLVPGKPHYVTTVTGSNPMVTLPFTAYLIRIKWVNQTGVGFQMDADGNGVIVGAGVGSVHANGQLGVFNSAGSAGGRTMGPIGYTNTNTGTGIAIVEAWGP